MKETGRFALAVAGPILWLSYPIAFLARRDAVWRTRCDGRSFTGSFDDCFNDTLPVVEILFVPFLTLLLAYPVARFAFALFAPPAAERIRGWGLAGSDAATIYLPAFPLLCGAGVVWAIVHLVIDPIDPRFWYAYAYWGAWIAWFATGAAYAWPRRDERMA